MKHLFILAFVCFNLVAEAQQLFNEQALIDNLKYLSSDALEGRKPETKGSEEARVFIKTQFKKLKLQPLGKDFELPFEFENKSGTKVKGVNLAGVIKGSDKEQKYIVISAHYDHVGIIDGKIYNGADDNASGTCALFALTEYFKKNKPKHNILIVAFDAEEMGLRGAKAFVKNPPVEIAKIVTNINMDMVSRADNKELVACGTFFYPELKTFVDSLKIKEPVKFVYGHDDPDKYKGEDNWTFSSDHGPFHDVKIPFIYFGVADHKDYHQETDEFQNVEPEVYKSCVRLIVLASSAIDQGLN